MVLIETLENQLPSLEGAERFDALLELVDYLANTNYRRALELSHEAADLARVLNDEDRLTEAFLRIGRVNVRMVDYEKAEKAYETALERCQKANNKFGQAFSLNGLGSIKFGQGQYLKSLEYYLVVLPLSQERSFLREELRSLRGLGNVYTRLGEYALSFDYYLKAIELCEISLKTKEHQQISAEYAMLLISMADQLLRLEKWNESLEYSERSLEINKRVGNKQIEIVCRENFAEAYLQLKLPAQARPILEEALELSRQIDEKRLQIRILNFLGQAEAALGNSVRARECFAQGLKLARLIDSPEEELLLQTSYAQHLLEYREVSAALDVLQQTLQLSERLGLPAETCRVHELLVRAKEQQSLFQEALIHRKEYLTLKLLLHGEKHFNRIEVLQVQHEVEKARQIAEVQRVLNEELQRANDELAQAHSQNQELLEQVKYQARHDALTGLPNRALFEDRLSQAINYAARYNLSLAVLFLDLDGFKAVNDTLGHDAGDELLVQVAARFKNSLRESDTVARFGGDEFVIVAGNLNTCVDADLIARKLLKSLEAEFDIHNQKVSINASIGVSLYPQDGNEVATLLKQADAAMYNIKHGVKGNVSFYAPGMNQAETLTLSMPSLN